MRSTAASGTRGVTLVELLVVISIVLLLAVIGVRALGPTLEGQRIREASRMINVYFGSARNRAIETGRPCGVILRRFDGQPECAMVLEQAEVPPPYAGDTLDATATVAISTSGTWLDGSPKVEAVLTDFTPDLVHGGDLIQFNHQGPFYRIGGPDANGGTVVGSGSLELWTDRSQGQMLPWRDAPNWSAPLPYEIIRQPVNMKSVVAPLQLPAGTVVDLEASGTDSNLFGTGGDVYVMFSPNGSVDQVYLANIGGPVTDPVFLLVGRRERVTGIQLPANPGEDERPNWTDQGSLWITINPQTGLVTTTENNPVDTTGINWATPDKSTWRDPFIIRARDLARQGQSMGGR